MILKLIVECLGLEVPTKELCETCICGLADSGQPEVKCHAFVCAIKCPEGFEKVYNDTSCCGYCKLIPTPACDPKQCPEINCRSNMQVRALWAPILKILKGYTHDQDKSDWFLYLIDKIILKLQIGKNLTTPVQSKV